MMSSVLKLVCSMVICIAGLVAEDKPIDLERSSITIHVLKTGALSFAGHDHWVNAPVSAGVLNDSDGAHVEFRVDASKMEVKPDPKVDSKTQAQIQTDMQQQVLESAKYPEITFRSTRADWEAEGQWRVQGMLTLHGITKPVTVTAKRTGDAYVSHVVLKQTDFGIKPITAVGGLVKVKNELEIDFRIVPRSD